MSTSIDIANMALALVGGERITSFTEDSKSAVLVDQFYEQVYRASLQEFNWRCAIVQKALASDSTSPVFTEWAYRYRMPTDPLCLRVISFNNPRLIFDTEQEFIYTNESEIKIKYVGRITEGRLDPQAARYIYYRLASNICFDLTGDRLRQESIASQIESIVMPAAKTANAIARNVPDKNKQYSSWVDARDFSEITATG